MQYFTWKLELVSNILWMIIGTIVTGRRYKKHVHFGIKRTMDDDNDIQIISQYLEQWGPCLWNREQKLVYIGNRVKAGKEMVENVKNTKKCGKKAMEEFKGRFASREGNTMTEKKNLLWLNKNTTSYKYQS